ncbi:MAG: hypothetical protein CM1200mP38_7310 [Dehalococcoidia bacterium]|nr:MAG: hypothetical protein CM1200mP38_7310 [Dehalococcoidia bacterium]
MPAIMTALSPEIKGGDFLVSIQNPVFLGIPKIVQPTNWRLKHVKGKKLIFCRDDVLNNLDLKQKEFPGLRIGVSSCLLGEKVRYNSTHVRDVFLLENPRTSC